MKATLMRDLEKKDAKISSKEEEKIIFSQWCSQMESWGKKEGIGSINSKLNQTFFSSQFLFLFFFRFILFFFLLDKEKQKNEMELSSKNFFSITREPSHLSGKRGQLFNLEKVVTENASASTIFFAFICIQQCKCTVYYTVSGQNISFDSQWSKPTGHEESCEKKIDCWNYSQV